LPNIISIRLLHQLFIAKKKEGVEEMLWCRCTYPKNWGYNAASLNSM